MANPTTPNPPQGEIPPENPVPQEQPNVEMVDANVHQNEEIPIDDEEFALTPALATKDRLAYTGTDSKIYKNGSAKLPVDIDCTPDNLNIVLAAIEARAVEYGWLDTILNIYDEHGTSKDLLTQYGEITMSQIKDHVSTYHNKKGRAAQDSMMLFTCITNSLTQQARKKLILYKKEYYINDRTPSGALLLKVLIRESHIDTNATVKIVRENLSSLDIYMVKIDSDIEKFNRYVYENLLQLQSRGHSTLDLMANLFKGYAKASDKTFVAYIAKKEDDFDEGRDIGHDVLMQLALQKYKVLKEAGKWNAPSDAEEKIIALQAEITKLKEKTKGHNTNKYKGQGHNKQQDSSNKSSPKTYGKNPGKKPAWMLTKPKDGESHTKSVEGKEYHWCATHAAWTRHKQSECKGKGYIPPTDDKDKKRKSENATKEADSKKKPKMVAMPAMYDGSSDEE